MSTSESDVLASEIQKRTVELEVGSVCPNNALKRKARVSVLIPCKDNTLAAICGTKRQNSFTSHQLSSFAACVDGGWCQALSTSVPVDEACEAFLNGVKARTEMLGCEEDNPWREDQGGGCSIQ